MNGNTCSLVVRNALFLLLCSPLWACDILSTDCSSGKMPPDQAHRVTISQGAWGQVRFWEGEFGTHGPTYGCPGGKVRPVQRLILIHDVAILPGDVAISDWPPGRSLFTEVHTPVVDSVRSDSKGFFEIALPPGRYSLFVREDSLYFARADGPERELGLVEVPEAGVDRVNFDLQYKATF